MRSRNLEKRRKQLKEKFLSEVPQSERARYFETVNIFVDAAILGYLFKGFTGDTLVEHLLIEIPRIEGYEHCVYSTDSLRDVLGKYATRVERKFYKYRSEVARNSSDELFS